MTRITAWTPRDALKAEREAYKLRSKRLSMMPAARREAIPEALVDEHQWQLGSPSTKRFLLNRYGLPRHEKDDEQ